MPEFADQEPGAAAMHPHEPSRAEIDAAHQKKEAAERDELSRKRAERDAKLAEFNTHPHTQMTGILRDLRSSAATAGDSATKHAHLHSAVVRLTQMMLSAIKAPQHPDEVENGDGERVDERR